MKYNNETAQHIFCTGYLDHFELELKREEKSAGTIDNYLRHVRAFSDWLEGRQVTKQTAAGWKEYLIEKGYTPVTVNTMLSAINTFFRIMGWTECRVGFLKIQRRLFRSADRELSRSEYGRLVKAAQREGKTRMALILETICSTGIRVSELKYITMEAAKTGRADISLKGKVRVILMPKKLCRKLTEYAKKQKIASGEIFLTGNGKSINRKQIWSEMKTLAKSAGIPARKVFPHNLRHLFARAFYKASHDTAKLADVLGHSSIETTRIYLISTGEEHVRELDRLGLVV